jgi:hypothetical protein
MRFPEKKTEPDRKRDFDPRHHPTLSNCFFKVDAFTAFTDVGLDAAIIDSDLKAAFKNNIRRNKWRQWAKESQTLREIAGFGQGRTGHGRLAGRLRHHRGVFVPGGQQGGKVPESGLNP